MALKYRGINYQSVGANTPPTCRAMTLKYRGITYQGMSANAPASRQGSRIWRQAHYVLPGAAQSNTNTVVQLPLEIEEQLAA